MPDSTEKEGVREEIARRAYQRFCDRGCTHGSDTEDWLAAEGEVLAQLQTTEISAPTNDNQHHHRTRGRQ